ncbi:glycosyltransferase family 2 protein [Cumulibacter soli]|uniref:glycosyltransferase family 2 protein n=1 Tax=Cumulibacter soli TaxID=2546344 RepID=UPI0010678CE9|nr:glycosyltransferase [Cumulibacter soli]
MSTVSIIVPVYRGTAAARRCVLSIARQTRPVDELVLVDDRGRDGAFEAAVQEARMHGVRCIEVRQESNRGVSAARNSGLAAASGEFVGFVDADDAIEPDFVAELSQLLAQYDVNLAVCGSVRVSTDGRRAKDIEDVGFPLVLSGQAYARKLLTDDAKGYVCNKLFRRTSLGAAPFAEGRVYEDFPVVLAIALESERVAFSPRPMYLYTLADGSVSRRFGPHVGDLDSQLVDVRRIVGERSGLDAELRAHRVGGVVLPMANMAWRARHDPEVATDDRLAVDLITRARRLLRVSDMPMLALNGHRRLALAAGMLKASPALYGRVLRYR